MVNTEKSNEPLISVIVPVYKVEPYLRQCLDSILAQTYKNLEIILVDDGSPDNCPAICDEYAKKDSRVTVIHKENGGLGSARNAGLDICHGEYIGFVDSDDWLDPDVYRAVADGLLKTDLDMAVIGYKEFFDDGTEKTRDISAEGDIVTQAELLCEGRNINVMVCNKIFRRKVWEKLRFPAGILFEDEYTYPYYASECDGAVICGGVYYHYRRHAESITERKFSEKNLDSITASWHYAEWYRQNMPDMYPRVALRKAYAIAYNMKRILLSHSYLKYRKIYKNLKKQLSDEYEKARPYVTDETECREFVLPAVHDSFRFALRVIYYDLKGKR